MSAALDAATGDPYYTQSVGPQSDGTYGIPRSGQAVTPYDAGGGPSANYSAQILDVFKFGVGVWQQQSNQSAMLDYKRFEATQNGLFQQGQQAGIYATGGTGNNNLILLLAVVVGVVMLAR